MGDPLKKETGLEKHNLKLTSEDLPTIEGKAPQARFVKVTPEIARTWLSKNHDQQRNIRDSRIKRYASQMTNGRWKISSDGIAFDTNGDLINGQHRLKAVVESGQEEWMLVVWNLDPETRKYIDEGLKRNPGDALTVHGFNDPMHVAAAVRLVIFWRRNELRRCAEYNAIQNYEIVQAAETCTPRIYDSVDWSGNFENTNVIPRSLHTFAHFLYEPTYGSKAEEALEKICTMERIDSSQWGGENDKSPAKLVNDMLTDEDKDLERHQKLAYLIKGMNWYCNGEGRSRLRFRKQDKFPVPAVDELPEYRGEDGSSKQDDLFEGQENGSPKEETVTA